MATKNTKSKEEETKQEVETQAPADDMMTPTETSDNEQSPMLQLGGLWINESKSSGKKYMVGYLGNLKLMIFRNTFKKKDNEPDYRMYVTEKPYETNDSKEDETDDIPF